MAARASYTSAVEYMQMPIFEFLMWTRAIANVMRKIREAQEK